MECIDVNLVVDDYNTVLSSLLDSHAPLKTDYVTSRILHSWMSEEILSVKREKRKSELTWRKTKLTGHLEIFRALCLKLKTLIYDARKSATRNKFQTVVGINFLVLLTLF